MKNLKYLFVGLLFGIVFVKSEVISWFRIQEMFRLQSFHMYGIIGSAVITAMISIFIIKRFKIKTIYGEPIKIAPKTFNKGQIYGGLIFGFGWALTGCLSRAAFRADWHGGDGCWGDFAECHCGHMGVRPYTRQAAALIQRGHSRFLMKVLGDILNALKKLRLKWLGELKPVMFATSDIR